MGSSMIALPRYTRKAKSLLCRREFADHGIDKNQPATSKTAS
jgi:hypothetical protein